ncbi:MAG: iron-containing alcohol dehydrogenase [Planctomycetota bacterium]|nr:MAG: iron-containing alcohol dehydrogenase [Planctomycetota bacterium]
MFDLTPNDYDFLAPRHIVFGWGRWREVGPLAAGLGRRALVVLGSRTLERNGMVSELHDELRDHRVEPVALATISREPTVEDVDAVIARACELSPAAGDFVLALGGGSALDLGKAVAALATNREGSSVRDYLEGVGRGLKLSAAPLPVLAMPTTAGTGSEATKNAVISVHSPAVKKSLRDPRLVPSVVLVDSQLGVSLPSSTTAHTGMDAITQLIESYISRRAKPIPQALALQGVRMALPAIERAVEDGACREAREAMAHAALLSGMALANSGLGMAHGVAAALGVHCEVAHGLACAVMLPLALRANRDACQPQLAQLAAAVSLADGRTESEAAEAFIEHVEQIAHRIGIPRQLRAIGVDRNQIGDLVRDSKGNSMNGNPRTLADEELAGLLDAQW